MLAMSMLALNLLVLRYRRFSKGLDVRTLFERVDNSTRSDRERVGTVYLLICSRF